MSADYGYGLSKKPLVTFEMLGDKQKCIYQAFGCVVTEMTQEAMAALVNRKGKDADDGAAVAILAHEFGFRNPITCTAAYFQQEVAFTPGADYIVVVAASHSCATVKARFANLANLGVEVGDRALYDPTLQKVAWHAIYGRAEGTRVQDIIWYDEQKQRLKGPQLGDCVVFYERPPG